MSEAIIAKKAELVDVVADSSPSQPSRKRS